MKGEMPAYYNEKRYIRKDGSTIWVRLNAAFIRDADGQAIRTVAICEDITGRKLAEEQLRSSLAEKEVLVKEVHHRVKNILQIMSSLISLQSDSLADEKLQRGAKRCASPDHDDGAGA
jgi:DNA-directed RNA polymerase specialized sigma54-like protein